MNRKGFISATDAAPLGTTASVVEAGAEQSEIVPDTSGLRRYDGWTVYVSGMDDASLAEWDRQRAMKIGPRIIVRRPDGTRAVWR